MSSFIMIVDINIVYEAGDSYWIEIFDQTYIGKLRVNLNNLVSSANKNIYLVRVLAIIYDNCNCVRF